jgi:hypothetical protein
MLFVHQAHHAKALYICSFIYIFIRSLDIFRVHGFKRFIMHVIQKTTWKRIKIKKGEGGLLKMIKLHLFYHYTSLNPMPNAQVCVYLTIHITKLTTNYISKTSLYTTFRMYPLGLWLLKILMFALLVTHEIATYSWPWEKTGDDKYTLGLLLILISKSGGCPALGPGMPFRHSDTCAEGGGYLFLPGFYSLYDAIHGWMKSFTKNDHDILYYM